MGNYFYGEAYEPPTVVTSDLPDDPAEYFRPIKGRPPTPASDEMKEPKRSKSDSLIEVTEHIIEVHTMTGPIEVSKPIDIPKAPPKLMRENGVIKKKKKYNF